MLQIHLLTEQGVGKLCSHLSCLPKLLFFALCENQVLLVLLEATGTQLQNQSSGCCAMALAAPQPPEYPHTIKN